MVVPLARYNSTEQKFETPQAISKDKLLPKGHQYCRCDEFHLGKLLSAIFKFGTVLLLAMPNI